MGRVADIQEASTTAAPCVADVVKSDPASGDGNAKVRAKRSRSPRSKSGHRESCQDKMAKVAHSTPQNKDAQVTPS